MPVADEHRKVETYGGLPIVIVEGAPPPSAEELREKRSERMAELLIKRRPSARDLGLHDAPYKNEAEVKGLREEALEAEVSPRLASHFQQLMVEEEARRKREEAENKAAADNATKAGAALKGGWS